MVIQLLRFFEKSRTQAYRSLTSSAPVVALVKGTSYQTLDSLNKLVVDTLKEIPDSKCINVLDEEYRLKETLKIYPMLPLVYRNG